MNINLASLLDDLREARLRASECRLRLQALKAQLDEVAPARPGLCHRHPRDVQAGIEAGVEAGGQAGGHSNDPSPPLQDNFGIAPERGILAIGDMAPISALAGFFESQEWRAQWRPGIDLHGYVIGCDGLQRLAHYSGEAIVKFGTCAMAGLNARTCSLGRQGYGSISRSRDGYAAEEGWSLWTPFRTLALAPQSPLCPIRRSTQSLIITLPEGVSAGQGEAAINRALAKFSLLHFADSDEGRKICARRGIDPGRLLRFSPEHGDRISAATELLLMRPQADASRLAAILAGTVIGLVPGTVPASSRN